MRYELGMKSNRGRLSGFASAQGLLSGCCCQMPISWLRMVLHPAEKPKARRIWTLTSKPRALYAVHNRGGQAILQPAPLSAKAFAATPITLFSLFSTWRM